MYKQQSSLIVSAQDSSNGEEMFSEWAYHAGRLMIEEGIIDYAFAKQKAEKQLGGNTNGLQPSNAKVEIAAQSYYQLHKTSKEDQWHLEQLQFASDSLQALEDFRPCLAGTLLKGRPNALDEIEIHACADTSETVMEYLLQFTKNIELNEKLLRFSGDSGRYFLPMFCCEIGDFTAQVVVFDESFEHLSPISSLSKKTMQRWKEPQIANAIADLKASMSSTLL
jgi:hypothetical protein